MYIVTEGYKRYMTEMGRENSPTLSHGSEFGGITEHLGQGHLGGDFRRSVVDGLAFYLSPAGGQVEGQAIDDGTSKVAAKVPLAEMFGYATELRSMTQGRGIFSMEFSHYEDVPRNVAEAIISKNQGNS